VNNLPRVVTQPCLARDRTRDLLIASPTPYRCATTSTDSFLVSPHPGSPGRRAVKCGFVLRCILAPEMLDPKLRVRADDGGAAFEWMSVPPAEKEVAIQPATTDVFLQQRATRRADNRSPADTVLSTRSLTF